MQIKVNFMHCQRWSIVMLQIEINFEEFHTNKNLCSSHSLFNSITKKQSITFGKNLGATGT